MKAVQVVVQARLGERVTAPRFVKPDGYVLSFVNQNMTKNMRNENFHFLSKPDTSGGTSWFNLAVKDNVEVMTETKRALGGQVNSQS